MATLGAVAATIATAQPRFAHAQTMPKLRFGMGTKSMNATTINMVIGEALGYNKQEGFSIDPVPLGAIASVQIGLDKGDLQFGVGAPSFALPLYAKGELPPIVSFYEYTYPYKWDVAVAPDSPIKSYNDLKGKKIGVSGLGTTDYPVTRAVIANLGMEKTAFPAPVFAGDTIRVRTTVVSHRESRSRADAGIVVLRHEAFKQDGTLVATCERAALMRKAPA